MPGPDIVLLHIHTFAFFFMAHATSFVSPQLEVLITETTRCPWAHGERERQQQPRCGIYNEIMFSSQCGYYHFKTQRVRLPTLPCLTRRRCRTHHAMRFCTTRLLTCLHTIYSATVPKLVVDARMSRCANARMSGRRDARITRCSNAGMSRRRDARITRCPNARTSGRRDARMSRCPNARTSRRPEHA